MKKVYEMLILIVFIAMSLSFLQASSPVPLTPDGHMYLLNGEEDGDVAEVLITGNGEECNVYMDSTGHVNQTSCQQLVNSKKIRILCTPTKKLCKTEQEVYNALMGNIKGEHIRMPGVYTITAQELNVRNKPSKSSTILGTLKYGDRVLVHKFYDKWGQTDYGWVSGKYLKLISPKEPKVNSIHFAKNTTHLSDDYSDMQVSAVYLVDIGELNIRSRPDINSNVLGTVKRGEKVNIYKFVGKWGESDQGWISGKYLKYYAPIVSGSKNISPSNNSLEDSNEESYAWYEIIGILVLLGLFFKYWKVVLGFIVLIAIGQGILESMGINPANFLIGAGVFLVVIMGAIAYFSCSGEKCPKCSTCVKEPIKERLIEQHYKYATKSGGPDKRYKDNPLISTYEYTYKCTNEECGHIFTCQITY